MGKCVICGKQGLFVFVDSNGYCIDCEIKANVRAKNETVDRNNKKSARGKSTAPIGGDIGYLGLENFWFACTNTEQKSLIRYSKSCLGASPNASPISGPHAYNITKLSFLADNLMWAVAEKNWKLAEKLIQWAEKYYDNERDYVKKHNYLHTVSEYYYKIRDVRQDALQLVEKYCKRDIEICPMYLPILHEGCDVMPHVQSFKRLAIMYEKQGRYADAIEICKKALWHGLDDGTKSGYLGRIEKLKRKC